MEAEGPIVCFLSEMGDTGGALRTLVQTSPIGFALPALAEITLAATGWHHDPIQQAWRRSFLVHVSMPF